MGEKCIEGFGKEIQKKETDREIWGETENNDKTE
jgi:hypothetical protein